jgi:hypothetical protein
MTKYLQNISAWGDHVSCYGNFNLADVICRKGCAIRLRCAIDKNNANRSEPIWQLVSSDEVYLIIQ